MATVNSLPILQGTLLTVGPWFSTHGRRGLRIWPYQRGGVVKTSSTGTTLTLYNIGEIAASDYIMVCTAQSYGDDNVFTPQSSRIVQVSSIDASAHTLTLASAVTVTAGDYVFCLGADTGGASPNFDASLVTLYDDPIGNSASANKYLTSGSSAGYIGWVERTTRLDLDLLITDGNNTVLAVEIQKQLLPQTMGLFTYRGTRQTLTIDTGAVTLPTAPGGSEFIVAAETGTTDTLSTISGGDAGDVIILTADTGDTITVDENGNILVTGTTRTLAGNDILELRYDGTSWAEKSYVDH